jgi:hypothetical protein
MSVRLNQIIKSMSLSIVFLFVLGLTYVESHAQETKLAQATFYVY